MKIVHVALCGPVTDRWTYQDNLLPKYHKMNGHDVVMITSKYVYNSKGKIVTDNRDSYINENDIKTIRLKTINNRSFSFKFKRYVGLFKALKEEKPDVIFVHGCQFLDIKHVVKYVRLNPTVKIYVDNHADFSNSAKTFLSKNVLHKIIWKYCAHQIEPYTSKFYGVLPARVDFLRDVYNLPETKIDLLVMGADDEKVNEANNKGVKNAIREKYNIKLTDFLIVTGGKIDLAKKQTLLLMQAIKEIDGKNVKLIVFGSVVKELESEVESLADGDKVQYVGWIDAEDSYKYFAASDLVVFPGRHSVFWEQVAGLGIPMIVKHWEGTTHVDVGGNCRFIYKNCKNEIKSLIEKIINDKETYLNMKAIAESKGVKRFAYSRIAKESIR